MAAVEFKRFSRDELKKVMKDKGFTIHNLAKECGMGHSTLERYMTNESAPEHILKLLTLVLGCTMADLEKKPEPVKTSASDIINSAMNSAEIESLKKEVDALRLDLQNMAKMLIQINKTCNETKAQAELNHEQITATFNKQTETASNVAKIYGKVNHKF